MDGPRAGHERERDVVVSLTLVASTADIVAFPFQVPAYAAGIVAPVVCGGGDVAGVVCGAVAARRTGSPGSSGLDGIACLRGGSVATTTLP